MAYYIIRRLHTENIGISSWLYFKNLRLHLVMKNENLSPSKIEIWNLTLKNLSKGL